MREVTRHYQDPLDKVWTGCAARVGLRVVRTTEAYATTDGRGTLGLSNAEAMDGDDCLAQMIFHELCHSLVEGPESLQLRDWGLDNQTDRDSVREHACLRLQALLSQAHGLREVLAPTTDYRVFYDALGDDPLADDASSQLARIGAARVSRWPWDPHVEQALQATEQIVRVTARYSDRQSLFGHLEPTTALHRAGFPLARTGVCGTCSWRAESGRCVQAEVQVEAALGACERWEPALDCQRCGACCREGYDTVEISASDPVRAKHPELVETRDGRLGIARTGSRCAALVGGVGGEPHVCRIYEDRPQPCRELIPGSQNCLIARRRVGLSR